MKYLQNLINIKSVCLFITLLTSISFHSVSYAKTRYIIDVAHQQIGKPYRYGGNHPKKGFDCSGLLQYSYLKAGIRIPRSSAQQFRTLKKISSPKPGDLVFFNISGRGVSHVGIYIGNQKMIHAPRRGKRVEIADMNNNYWKKRYLGARTVY